MKFDKKSKTEQQRHALFLRYGTESPATDPVPPALLTYSEVARLLKADLRRVIYLCRSYFTAIGSKLPRVSIQPPKLCTKHLPQNTATVKTLRPEEVEYLTDPDNLYNWAAYPLTWRCVLFHRKFPDRWLRRQELGKLYRQCNIRKKKVTANRAPRQKTLRISEFENKIVDLQDQVQEILDKKGHLVFVDESIFTARGYS